MQKVIDDLFNQGYSRNTLSTIRRIMSGACRYAFETDKLIASNPALLLRMPSPRAESDIPTRNKPNIFIPASMITRIFERFPEGTSAFIPMQLGYRCGMRLGEAFGVLWDDIDFQARKINIQRQIQWDKNGEYWYFTNPKYDSVRSIDIDSRLYDILVRAHESQHRAEQYYGEQYTKLFSSCNNVLNCSGDGKLIHPVAVRENGDYVIPRTMQHVSGVIHHELNFPEFTFHSLRHTHATMLIASGAPLKYVQERMGHKSIDVTLRVYTHMSSAQEQQGIDALETVFAN